MGVFRAGCRRVAILRLLLASLIVSTPLSAQFVDRAASSGVDLHYPAVEGVHNEPGIDPYNVGSASAAVDLDGDGWTDLIVTRTGAPCLVFMSNRDGTFREEAASRGLATVSDIGGIGAGDLDNDGDTDLFMVPVSGLRYFLFINDGTGHFTEVAVARGADSPVTIAAHRGQSVSMVDYDRDGYLDIHVSEWSVGSTSENAQHAVLLRNRGAAAPAFFENKTAAAGLVQPVLSDRIDNYASVWHDYDGDGYPDVFIVGDFGTSQMWWNNGDGTFSNGTNASGLENTAEAMGVTLLDYDGDGRIDIFFAAVNQVGITNTEGFFSDNRLYRNLGNRRFSNESATTGIKESGWGWGAQSLDANNDGWPDLAVTNGFIEVTGKFEKDPTALFINNAGTFSDQRATYGITDTGFGRSLVVFDYDNDGREDIFISPTIGHRILYHNQSPTTNAHWLALKFVGTTSNRDGYGSVVTITAGGRQQVAVYNPTNAYIGQREPRLHFGLGSSTSVSRISVKWPGGTVQEFTNVNADQIFTVTEATTVTGSTDAPVITTQPQDISAAKDSSATLSVAASGTPAPAYNWFKNGTRIDGQNGSTLNLDRIQPIDEGTYTVTATNPRGAVTSRGATVRVTANLSSKTVARWWDEALLDGIRKDTPDAPIHARNLYHISATLWDAFWAYERDAWASRHEVFVKESPELSSTEPARVAAQQEAMSYAAYTVIKSRFALSPGSAATHSGIRWLMQQYGYNPDLTSTSGNAPSAVGLRIGNKVLELTLGDGANEANDYADGTGYRASNPSLIVRDAGVGAGVNPDHWQPLNLANTVTQNGIVLGASVQTFLGVNAKNTKTFALPRTSEGYPLNDPGPPPRYHSGTRAEYIRQAQQLIQFSSELTGDDGATIDISPGKILNNPLGTNDGTGHATNPVTGQPYASNVVLRGDYGRVLAEFWADGPHSETPPGHWNVLFNEVSDHRLETHQFRGTGTVLRRLEWDVAGYLAINGAVHDAGSAAWAVKWEYDSSRPITMIRSLASLGSSGGLPQVPGLIETITAQSSAPGQRHANLAAYVGRIAIKSWLGTPPSATQTAGVGWVLGEKWVPYQKETFVSPSFPGYISGHSTFSRAAAVVLAKFTGSDFFPGGMATYDFNAGTGLGFEAGPKQNVQLQWATYFDAADQAGISRLYGGIHIEADDLTGRRMAAKIGEDAFNRFVELYNPSTPSLPAGSGDAGSSGGNSGGNSTSTPKPPATSGSSGTSSGGGGGGGGGSPSLVFSLLLLLLSGARVWSRRAKIL